jgi:hypothetical protein
MIMGTPRPNISPQLARAALPAKWREPTEIASAAQSG